MADNQDEIKKKQEEAAIKDAVTAKRINEIVSTEKTFRDSLQALVSSNALAHIKNKKLRASIESGVLACLEQSKALLQELENATKTGVTPEKFDAIMHSLNAMYQKNFHGYSEALARGVQIDQVESRSISAQETKTINETLQGYLQYNPIPVRPDEKPSSQTKLDSLLSLATQRGPRHNNLLTDLSKDLIKSGKHESADLASEALGSVKKDLMLINIAHDTTVINSDRLDGKTILKSVQVYAERDQAAKKEPYLTKFKSDRLYDIPAVSVTLSGLPANKQGLISDKVSSLGLPVSKDKEGNLFILDPSGSSVLKIRIEKDALVIETSFGEHTRAIPPQLHQKIEIIKDLTASIHKDIKNSSVSVTTKSETDLASAFKNQLSKRIEDGKNMVDEEQKRIATEINDRNTAAKKIPGGMVILELVDTEKSYRDSLQAVLDSKVLDNITDSKLRRSIEDGLVACLKQSNILLSHFENAVKGGITKDNLSQVVASFNAAYKTNFPDYQKALLQGVSGHDSCLEIPELEQKKINEIITGSPWRFNNLQSLDSCTIMPIQRGPRHLLVLKEVSKELKKVDEGLAASISQTSENVRQNLDIINTTAALNKVNFYDEMWGKYAKEDKIGLNGETKIEKSYSDVIMNTAKDRDNNPKVFKKDIELLIKHDQFIKSIIDKQGHFKIRKDSKERSGLEQKLEQSRNEAIAKIPELEILGPFDKLNGLRQQKELGQDLGKKGVKLLTENYVKMQSILLNNKPGSLTYDIAKAKLNDIEPFVATYVQKVKKGQHVLEGKGLVEAHANVQSWLELEKKQVAEKPKTPSQRDALHTELSAAVQARAQKLAAQIAAPLPMKPAESTIPDAPAPPVFVPKVSPPVEQVAKKQPELKQTTVEPTPKAAEPSPKAAEPTPKKDLYANAQALAAKFSQQGATVRGGGKQEIDKSSTIQMGFKRAQEADAQVQVRAQQELKKKEKPKQEEPKQEADKKNKFD